MEKILITLIVLACAELVFYHFDVKESVRLPVCLILGSVLGILIGLMLCN